MKKILVLILALVMICALCACTVPEIQIENPDGTQTVAGVVITQAVTLFFSALGMAISVLGALVLKALGNNTKLKNIILAWQRVCDAARQTCAELQQTTVEHLKADNDGKLTPAQINLLQHKLLEQTKNKLDGMTIELVNAAGMDLDAIIKGECEASLPWIKENAARAKAAPVPID